MKILANRINPICDSIIGSVQQAFIKNRSIIDTTLDILTVLRNQNDQSKQHWLLLLDQQKAFDRVNHSYLQLVLKKMNFETKFTKVVSTLFSTQQAYISDAGKISEPFKVERGVRQGDPLSPLLYIIAFTPYLQALQDNIQGIRLKECSFKLAAYADDLSIGISSTNDWENFTNITQKYEQASNALINKRKTLLIPLTENAKRVHLANSETLQIHKDNNSLTILGYEIDIKGNSSKEIWHDTIKKIKKKLNYLSMQNLSFKGKILLIKSLVISKMWYLSYLLPPSRKQLNDINSEITKWVKNNSRMLPRYSTFQLNQEQCGLDAPILKDMLDTRLISIWIKLLSKNCFWAITERDIISLELRSKRGITINTALNGNNIKLKG
jgi:hypothetical protein